MGRFAMQEPNRRNRILPRSKTMKNLKIDTKSENAENSENRKTKQKLDNRQKNENAENSENHNKKMEIAKTCENVK